MTVQVKIIDMEITTYISINDIIADCSLIVDDEKLTKFSPAYYTSLAQQAINEMSFETHFKEMFEDYDYPSSNKLQLPANAFNIQKVYLWNGGEYDITVNSMMKVWYKNNFVGTGYNDSYTADNKPNNTDVIITSSVSTGDYFYSISQGQILFSKKCSTYKKVRLIFKGTQTAIGEVPFIPEFFRQAVKGWIAVHLLRILSARDPKRWRALMKDEYSMLYDRRNGTWEQAMRRAKRTDDAEIDDLKTYLQRMNLS